MKSLSSSSRPLRYPLHLLCRQVNVLPSEKESSTTAHSVPLGADEIGPKGARAGTYRQTLAMAWRVSDHRLLTAVCVVALGCQLARRCSRTGASRLCSSYARRCLSRLSPCERTQSDIRRQMVSHGGEMRHQRRTGMYSASQQSLHACLDRYAPGSRASRPSSRPCAPTSRTGRSPLTRAPKSLAELGVFAKATTVLARWPVTMSSISCGTPPHLSSPSFLH
jgi:hypothetical protein